MRRGAQARLTQVESPRPGGEEMGVGAWRVAESTLLMLAFVGGTLGAYAGRAVFRHKTRKQPFNSNLFAIAVLQVLGLGALIGWWVTG